MYLPVEKAVTILRTILEGNSISSVARLFGVHPSTILKLMLIAGEKSERIVAEKIRNIKVRDAELDEV